MSILRGDDSDWAETDLSGLASSPDCECSEPRGLCMAVDLVPSFLGGGFSSNLQSTPRSWHTVHLFELGPSTRTHRVFFRRQLSQGRTARRVLDGRWLRPSAGESSAWLCMFPNHGAVER